MMSLSQTRLTSGELKPIPHDYAEIRNNLLFFILEYSMKKHKYISVNIVRKDIQKITYIPDSESLKLRYIIGFLLKEISLSGRIKLVSGNSKTKKFEVMRNDFHE